MSIPRNLSIIADTLNADGTFFTITDTGNLTFTGTGNRITGDFSNATQANRIAFQSSTTNGNTSVNAIPNGTATSSQFIAFAGTDMDNVSRAGLNTTSTAALFFADKTGTGTYLPMTFYTGGSERVRIDTSGNVGIGTSSPTAKLDVTGNIKVSGQLMAGTSGTIFSPLVSAGYVSGTSNIYIRNLSGVNRIDSYNDPITATYPFQLNASQIAFYIADAEKMRIDSSGNVGIGTSSPATKLNIGTGGVLRLNRTDNVQYSEISCAGSGVGTKLVDSNGDGFRFFNTATQVMTIDSSGNLLVGQTAVGTQDLNSYSFNVSTGAIAQNHITGTGSGASYTVYAYAGTVIGSVTQSGTTAVLYNVTSDQRLKENIQDADSASDLIDSLQVRQFDWKKDNTHQRYGFIAQELVTVAPEAVHQPTDPEEMMAVDYSKLVPMLVKEIQSLRKRLADAGIA